MSILDEIVAVKKEEVKILRSEYTLSRFSDSEHFDKQTLSMIDFISKTKDIAIIAEVKKASPSKGLIRSDFDHMKIAEIYFENKSAAVSVLTDQRFFQGNIQFLNDISRIKEAPLLRKDFIIDEYQVFEAKSNGADVILLIAEILSKNQIKELSMCTFELGLEVLLEIHSEEQLSKIDFSLNTLIGINNRNLSDFSVDINTTRKLSILIPENVVVISESGISNKRSIETLKETKVQGVLIGEHFMKSNNIDKEVKKMKEWCQREN
ncbi:MAG: indole-3-glycerol phosphate synthase TrpC [Calditrichia bacterium]|nr:indole-3-glycerol phosphate synthase TrpC [Calditrichia bacterium]